jgi:ABC-type uncharacterized transport system permease subunit
MKVYDLPENDPYVKALQQAQPAPQPRRGWELMLIVILVIVIAAAVWTLLPGWVKVAAGVLVAGILLSSVVLMAVGIRGAGTRRSDDNDNVYKAHEGKG